MTGPDAFAAFLSGVPMTPETEPLIRAEAKALAESWGATIAAMFKTSEAIDAKAQLELAKLSADPYWQGYAAGAGVANHSAAKAVSDLLQWALSRCRGGL